MNALNILELAAGFIPLDFGKVEDFHALIIVVFCSVISQEL